MKSRLFGIKNQTIDVDVALLIIRIICGLAFIQHGWGKIQNPLNWMGPDATIPGLFQLLAAISEFVGGMALVLGFLTRLGAFGIGCTMSVAIYFHSIVLGDPFVNMKGGSSFEPAIVYLSIAILLLIIGPGRFSLDRIIFGIEEK